MKMVDNTVYLSLEQSILVPNKTVYLEDIATIICANKEINVAIRKIKLFQFNSDNENYFVITIMKIIEQIKTIYSDVTVSNLGCTESIIYYKDTTPKSKIGHFLKAIGLMLLTFFGTAYSIMSYNGDVGSDTLLQRLYLLFTGNDVSVKSPHLLPGIICYSLGLGIGMIIFFNHGFNKNSINDPTPLQVQMRMYENEVNQSIIIDNSRKGKTIDVD